jgi:cell division protein FtsQ
MSAGRKTSARKGNPKTAAKKRSVEQGRANKLAAFGFTGFVVLMAGAAAIALDIPAKAMMSAGQVVGEAGFKVDGYQIVGLKHMDRKLIDAVVVDELRRAAAPSDAAKPAQPLVDVDRIRERLMEFGWVEDARVSRRLPDTLVIDIVERKPSALWQDRQQLALIDKNGVVLDRVALEKMPDLPLVIGPGANAQASQLNRLLASAPTLQPQLASATWVGRRRWDINFQSGETVVLPEGEAAARKAIEKFANLDKSSGLLGRGLLRFDMRVPGKMIVRLPRAPGEAISPEPAAPAPEAPVPASPTSTEG